VDVQRWGIIHNGSPALRGGVKSRQRLKGGEKPTFISESGFFECDVAYPK
jgi:hypothetical protein